LVDMNAVAAAVLGRIAGAVGGAEQRPERLGMLVDGDQADAGTDGETLALPTEAKLVDRLAYAFGDQHCLAQRAVHEQNAKLIAAQTGKHVGLAYTVLEQLAQLAQQLVPGGMTAGVVDDLELIQVHVAEDVLAT